MARRAETVTFSVMPSDRDRWERHQQARDVGRSDLWRHTLDLLDREQIVAELRELQDLGDASAALHLPDRAAVEDAMRRSLARAEHELDPQITQMVEMIAEPVTPPARRRRALPPSLLTGESREADAASAG